MTVVEKIAGLAAKRGPADERIDIIHFDLAGSIADIPAGIPGTEVLIIFWRGALPPDSLQEFAASGPSRNDGKAAAPWLCRPG